VVRLVRETGFDCITLDGEKGSAKGVLSGGYINKERSKMTHFKAQWPRRRSCGLRPAGRRKDKPQLLASWSDGKMC
jgi:hypothetical protein